MTTFVPEWAKPIDLDALATPGSLAARGAIVLVDAALLREHDPAWVAEIESTLGAIVAICADPSEATWARVNGAQAAAPASLLHASAELAHDVLSDLFKTGGTTAGTLERFMCDAIHEFRTPLTVISEFAGLFEDGIAGELTEQQKGYVGYIQAAVDRMGEQFDDYRDGLRMRLGTLAHEPSGESFTRVIENAATSMGTSIKRNDDVASTSLDGVDGKRLAEAIKRIIGGAQKLAAKGEEVELELGMAQDSTLGARHVAEVHVRYRGVVLSDEDVNVMAQGTVMRTNGFYRSVARVFGLGVSMARLFLAQSGGAIRLEIAEGSGGSFVVQVPVKKALKLTPTMPMTASQAA